MTTSSARPTRQVAVPRAELDAALAARAELGADMEPLLVEDFLGRIEQAIDARVDERVEELLEGRGVRRAVRKSSDRAAQFTGRIAASLALGIPLTAIAGGITGLPGVLGVLATVVGLNIYYAESEKDAERRDRDDRRSRR